MKTPTLLLLAFVLSIPTFARIIKSWPDEKLKENADLIVVATPILVHDTGEKTAIPGIRTGLQDGSVRPIPAITMETTFEVLSVQKGDKDIQKIVFRHLRRADKPGKQDAIDAVLMLGLVAFEPKEQKRFLMFLKRETDGRYSSVTGQLDPCGGVKIFAVRP